MDTACLNSDSLESIKCLNQYLAQQGYVVFSMDTRGMSGRGEAFEFELW